MTIIVLKFSIDSIVLIFYVLLIMVIIGKNWIFYLLCVVNKVMIFRYVINEKKKIIVEKCDKLVTYLIYINMLRL